MTKRTVLAFGLVASAALAQACGSSDGGDAGDEAGGAPGVGGGGAAAGKAGGGSGGKAGAPGAGGATGGSGGAGGAKAGSGGSGGAGASGGNTGGQGGGGKGASAGASGSGAGGSGTSGSGGSGTAGSGTAGSGTAGSGTAGSGTAGSGTAGSSATGGSGGSGVGGSGGGGAPSGGPAMGTNLSGMEWAAPGLRYGLSSLPNFNFTVPRAAEASYLAQNGFTKNRLPIQWELLQPVLHDTQANAEAKAVIGEPGAFHEAYASFITGVLDAHAAAGIKAIIDLHNYCRYQDFRYQPDGSVIGLVPPPNPLLRPYTSDGSQVQVRICALADGATLKVANLTDFWTKAAGRWKDHPGLGGYGLMNEPHDMPAPGGTDPSGGNEDLTIWPTFAQAAVDAIRAVDAKTPIYVSGNGWDSAMAIGTSNPGYPLKGENLIYEVHMYLDAYSNGYAFDYDTEVGKNFSAGIGSVPIDLDTGRNRLKIATDWAKQNGVKLALTEVGMPIDDDRWQEMFKRAVALAHDEGVEVYSWMGGDHWPARNYAINQVPGWHQNKTLEPLVSGRLKESAGIAKATLYDDGPGYAPAGSPLTVTVYARGYLASPLTLSLSASGGSLSTSQIVLPAGANGEATYTFTPSGSGVATITYASDGQLGGQVPPERKVYSLADPVSQAGADLGTAAMSILAKYGASRWDMADGYTDYVVGQPSGEGQEVRAVADSGFGSSVGNAMEMLDWLNSGSDMGAMLPPVMREGGGKKRLDLSAPGTFGLWCKKSSPVEGVQANPRNRTLYDLEDAHFVVAAVVPKGGASTGVVFQASKAEESYEAELGFAGGKPQARWVDSSGQTIELTAPDAAPAGAPVVLAMSSSPGAQSLRVNSSEVGSAGATLSPSGFNQMLIGWGFLSYYPRDGFGGEIYAVVTGKGTPSAAELAVLEKYLAKGAGLDL